MVSLDVTIVNVALPSIGRDFHASLSGLQWTVDAYTLVLAELLDAVRFNRRPSRAPSHVHNRFGHVHFGFAALQLGAQLDRAIVFRMLQALGGSMLNPVAMSIITNTFTNPKERAQAIGVWAAVMGFSMALGPIIGGLLVGSVGWRSIFWINIPIGLIAVVLALRFVPESRAAVARKVDARGQVLVVVLLASLTFGIIQHLVTGGRRRRPWSLCPLTCRVRRTRRVGATLRRATHQRWVLSFRTLLHCDTHRGRQLCWAQRFSLKTLYLQEVRELSPLGAG